MKHLIYLLCSVLASLLLFSCINDGKYGDDLYGQWQLKSLTVADSTWQPSGLYLSFQNNTVQAKIADATQHVRRDLVGNYVHQGDSLILSFQPYDIANTETLSDTLAFFGFEAPGITRLAIERLDNEKLELSRGQDVWFLRAY